MPIRRETNPKNVQDIWDAIRTAIIQHQQADIKKIIKYVQKNQKIPNAPVEMYVQQAVNDGLICCRLPLRSNTSNKVEDINMSYRIPTQETPIFDGKDWYCFECHLGGDVQFCTSCFRVYHNQCIATGLKRFEEFKKTSKTSNNIIINNHHSDNNDTDNLLQLSNDMNDTNKINNNIKDDKQYDNDLCSVCNISEMNNNNNLNLDKKELNYLLKYVVQRIQSWLPNVITHKMGEETRPEWLTEKELSWRAHQLFFKHCSMPIIETKLDNENYEKLCDFFEDILTIQHNVAIFHGVESQEYAATELMIRDCLYDLTEINICVDCYKHSNEKMNSKWFCLPCRIPHKLVWAKQKGYPYWPAKVIREVNGYIDVRFFGGKYERSLLNKSFVKPIDLPKEKLHIKSSATFNKAVEELKYHQKLIENPDELEKLINNSKHKIKLPKKSTSKKVKKNPKDRKNLSQTALLSSSSSLTTTTKTPTTPTTLSTNDVYQFNEDVTPIPPVPSFSLTHKRKGSYSEGGTSRKKNQKTDKVIKDEIDDKQINISDLDDEIKNKYQLNCGNVDGDGSLEQVTSSTENYRLQNSDAVPDEGMQQLDHPYSDAVEKMRRKLECLTENKLIIKCAMDCMQSELDKIANDHSDHIKKLIEQHNIQISETKKKQWCYNCEQDAIYHCCWNTAYCSQICQQEHWQSEHKKVCRRKR